MEQIKCHIKFYHNFFVYLPVLSIVTLILMIYTTYMFSYIAFLIYPHAFNVKPEDYSFNVINDPNAKTKGIALGILITWNFVFLAISMARTIFVDPGYLDNPNDIEYKISQFAKKKKNNEQKIEIQLKPRQKPVNIIHYFQTNIQEMPLNFQEFKEVKGYLIDAFQPSSSNTDDTISNIAEIEIEAFKKPKDIEKKEINFIQPLENFTEINFESSNFCTTCLRIKFERSHHCRQCGRCVLKMDHHCPWVANCIGFYNYKYFCLMNFYGFLTTFIFLASYWEVLADVVMNPKAHFCLCVFYLFIYMVAIGFLAFLTWLNTNNLRLLINGETVIEQSDRERFPSTKSINPYDLGFYKNFTSIFGSNPLVWFLPLFANYDGNGYIYQRNNLTEDDIKE